MLISLICDSKIKKKCNLIARIDEKATLKKYVLIK